jgi:hypothetical protein
MNPSGESREAEGSQITDTGRVVEDQGVSLAQSASERKEALCYVDGNFAYFTTQLLEDQWGDDCNDVPYEHNAGTPYEPQGGVLTWQIIKVAFDGSFLLPSDNHLNSPYSVEGINMRRDIPWLRTREHASLDAGATIAEFAKFVTDNGGTVYFAYRVSGASEKQPISKPTAKPSESEKPGGEEGE